MKSFKNTAAALALCCALLIPQTAAFASETEAAEETEAAATEAAAEETEATEAEATEEETEATTAAAEETTVESIDLSGVEFETVYGSQLYPFLNHQYYFEGEAVPIAQSNFYFINAFLDLTNYAYYGYYPQTSEGYFDLSAELGMDEYETYGDFFVSYAEQTLENTLVINLLAEQEGLELTDTIEAQIDNTIETLKTNGADAAGISVDEYIQLYYGPECDEAAFRELLRGYYMADYYTEKYCDEYEFTEDQLKVPEVTYALFYAPGDSSGEDDLTSAESLAKSMLEEVSSPEDIVTLGETYANDGYVYDYGDLTVSEGETVDAFEAWVFDESRKEGDLDVIYAEEYGYFVVGYVGIADNDEESLDNIAIADLSEKITADIEAGKYEFYTNDEYEKAVEVADTTTDDATASTDTTAADTASADTTAESDVTTKSSSTLNVVIIVLAIVGGVAIIGIIVVLVVDHIRKGAPQKSEPEEEPEDDTPDGESVEEISEDNDEAEQSDEDESPSDEE